MFNIFQILLYIPK